MLFGQQEHGTLRRGRQKWCGTVDQLNRTMVFSGPPFFSWDYNYMYFLPGVVAMTRRH